MCEAADSETRYYFNDTAARSTTKTVYDSRQNRLTLSIRQQRPCAVDTAGNKTRRSDFFSKDDPQRHKGRYKDADYRDGCQRLCLSFTILF